MSSISIIIDALAFDRSVNSKKAILEANRSDLTLKRLFELTYSNRINFYIRLTDVVVPFGNETITVDLLDDIERHLNGRIVTGNAARSYITDVLSDLQKEDQQIIIRMINRDMQCNVSAGLINATWDGLIPEFPQMLAEPFSPKLAQVFYDNEVGPDEKPKIVVQLKCDGGRAHVIVRDNTVRLYSRAGNELVTHGQFNFLLGLGDNFVIDGELLTVNESGKFNDRKTSNGIYNKAVRGTITPNDSTKLHLVAWDIIPVDEFWQRSGTETYETRLKNLANVIDAAHQHNTKISLVKTKLVRTVTEAQVFYSQMVDSGEEGAMLKLLSDNWEDIRSKRILKLKEIKDATLRCVGVTPHNKRPGQIGSLECVTECGELEASFGSGLTDDDRKLPPEFYIGKLIDVKYNQLIKSKTAGAKWSMFLPIFRSIRTDVTKADTLIKLQS